jgi:hypothetical protein
VRNAGYHIEAGVWVLGGGNGPADHHIEYGVSSPDLSREKRFLVVVASALDVARGNSGEGAGRRATLLVRRGVKGGTALVTRGGNTATLPLEDAHFVVLKSIRRHPRLCGTVLSVHVSARKYPDHNWAGRGGMEEHITRSLLPDADARVAEVAALKAAVDAAQRRNAVLDLRTLGNIATSASHCIASFPCEEDQLWAKLVAVFPADVTRLLESLGVPDCEELSLACVWTRRPGDAWWGLWTANVLKAAARGQVLVVCSRRD